MSARLAEIAPRDVAELDAHLRRRAESRANAAVRELAKRAEAEAKDMVGILHEQKKHIAATLAEWRKKEDDRQTLLFPPEELRQLAADRRHQERRLKDIDVELSTEPERIRHTYAVKARRVEPVGIVYLWPRTG